MRNSIFMRTAVIGLASAFSLSLSPSADAFECNRYVGGGDPAPAPNGTAPGHANSPFAVEVQKAKLQIGDESDTCFSQNEISDIDAFNNHFWLSGSQTTILFKEYGDSHRSELREEREFKIGDPGNDYLRAKIKLTHKYQGAERITLAQVHSQDSSGPVARLAWYAEGAVKDVDGNSPEGIWVTLRQGPSCSGSTCFSHSYIGDIEENYTTYRMGIFKGAFRLKVGNTYVDLVREDIFDDDNDGDFAEKKTSNAIDLTGSDWDGKDLYLKLGIYINSEGGGRAAHRVVAFF